MEKYIHYCWFGDKPLPKLAKKCIKSWQKYLPDYKIMKWSEENVNLDECPFIRGAYDKKKWAFVADYVRAKVMYEYGGIYFDTDMLVVKNIDFLLENESFIGVEDSNMIACGIWGEKHSKSYLSKKLLDYYKAQDEFDDNDMFAFSIPKLITNALKPCGYDPLKKGLQVLDNGFYIYPRDYFYPLSYNHRNNLFTDNTCCIHYYDASWVSKWEQRENKIFRTLGQERGQQFINMCRFAKRNTKRVLKLPVYPYVLHRRKKRNEMHFKEIIDSVNKNIAKVKDNNYVIIHNPNFLGITTATKELFDSTLELEEVYNEKALNEIANILCSQKFKLIAFSGLADGYDKIIKKIKEINPKIKVKIIWHGGNAPLSEDYEWIPFTTILNLANDNYIDSIAFVKKSMYELYKRRGYKTEFLMNTLKLDAEKYIVKRDDSDTIKLGLYASGDRWVKNFYNQLAAASLIENAEIECIPVTNKTMEFARLLGVVVNGATKPVSREKLLKMMSRNDVNVYTTFTECAPMIPLESLELGVPCITSNNHHYFDGTKLEEYLIVNKNDDPIAIANQIEKALKNKNKILKIYKEWKKEYDEEALKSVKKFLSK